jgi:hypothetical protein
VRILKKFPVIFPVLREFDLGLFSRLAKAAESFEQGSPGHAGDDARDCEFI